MDAEPFVDLRDFVYLDVERVKSLLAQVDRGLLSDIAASTGTSNSLEGKAGISIPALFEIGGTGNYVTTNQSTETRTLHDFVYNQTEEKLRELGRVRILPDDFQLETVTAGDEIRSNLSPVEYVLLRGRVELNDYEYMRSILENINDFQRIFTEIGYQDQVSAVFGKEKDRVKQKIREEVTVNKLDENYLKNLRRIFDFFLKDRLSIKVMPFTDNLDLRFVGPLQRLSLRERLEDIRFKFGASPVEEWVVFGQIAAVPNKDESRMPRKLSYSNELEAAFQVVFDSLLGIDDQFRISYPEVAITPIAVYRD